MVDRLGGRRGSLPVPDRQHLGLVTYDAKDPDTSFPPIEPLLPPDGAPNVLVILLDDVGFGAASAFGGPVETPVAERLQAAGLTTVDEAGRVALGWHSQRHDRALARRDQEQRRDPD